MENKIGAWGLSSGIEEMLEMPVVRKYMDMEWLSKISSSQFKSWDRNSRELLRRSEKDEAKIDELIWEEIERREKLYQLYKERQGLEAQKRVIQAEKRAFEKKYKHDMLYNPKTFDMVATPATKNAFWTSNGRIHRKDKYEPVKEFHKTAVDYVIEAEKRIGFDNPATITGTTKQHHYDKDWMCGEIYDK